MNFLVLTRNIKPIFIGAIILGLNLKISAQTDSLCLLGKEINSFEIPSLSFDTTSRIFKNPIWNRKANKEILNRCLYGFQSKKNDTIFHFGHPTRFHTSVQLYFERAHNIPYRYEGDLIDWSKVCSSELSEKNYSKTGINIDSLRIDYEDYLLTNLKNIQNIYEKVRDDTIITKCVETLRNQKSGFSVDVEVKNNRISILKTTYWDKNDSKLLYEPNEAIPNTDLEKLINRIQEITPDNNFDRKFYMQFSNLTI